MAQAKVTEKEVNPEQAELAATMAKEAMELLLERKFRGPSEVLEFFRAHTASLEARLDAERLLGDILAQGKKEELVNRNVTDPLYTRALADYHLKKFVQYLFKRQACGDFPNCHMLSRAIYGIGAALASVPWLWFWEGIDRTEKRERRTSS